MWKHGKNTSHDAGVSKKSQLDILPVTVSQLLSASQTSSDGFAICGWELHQNSEYHSGKLKVSVVGIIRGLAPFVTNVQYSVDDMTGPPLTVRLWVNMEDCSQTVFASPGMYVKVIGSPRNFNDVRSLLAVNLRCITDPNEITSHMLEVVQAHKRLFGKVFDVNMNQTATGVRTAAKLSTIQSQVFSAIQKFSAHEEGISFHDLRTELDYIAMLDIRTSLAFLINEGHIFTIDEDRFKTAGH